MKMKVNGKEFNIEFTFEAALSETLSNVYDFFSNAYLAREFPNGNEGFQSDEEMRRRMFSAMTKEVAKTPKLAIEMFHIGLLESHGNHSRGDKSILSFDDAKDLYREFCLENPDNELSYNLGLFQALKEQMVHDGFFKRIGVDKMMKEVEAEEVEAEEVEAEEVEAEEVEADNVTPIAEKKKSQK